MNIGQIVYIIYGNVQTVKICELHNEFYELKELDGGHLYYRKKEDIYLTKSEAESALAEKELKCQNQLTPKNPN